MDDINTSAPLPQVEEETQPPPTPVETTTVMAEVTTAGTIENPINGGGVGVAVGGDEATEGGGSGESRGVDPEVTSRRKRGRPRKHPVESPEVLPSLQILAPKRERGRPPGTGRLQLLAAMGRLAVDTAGGNFTPYVLDVQVGEDIVGKLSSVDQVGPRAICILSAVGSIAIVDIRPAGYSGSGILRYEGRFPLLQLSGTYTLTEDGQRTGRLSVTLADAGASVFGGLVVGSLIAAEPTQIILGSFKPSNKTLPRMQAAKSSTATDGTGRFRIPPKIVELLEVEEKFIVTAPSPPPKPANGDVNPDVNHASLQSSEQNASQPSDHVPDATVPDN